MINITKNMENYERKMVISHENKNIINLKKINNKKKTSKKDKRKHKTSKGAVIKEYKTHECIHKQYFIQSK